MTDNWNEASDPTSRMTQTQPRPIVNPVWPRRRPRPSETQTARPNWLCESGLTQLSPIDSDRQWTQLIIIGQAMTDIDDDSQAQWTQPSNDPIIVKKDWPIELLCWTDPLTQLWPVGSSIRTDPVLDNDRTDPVIVNCDPVLTLTIVVVITVNDPGRQIGPRR